MATDQVSQLLRKRARVKGDLTRMQTYIEAGELDIHEVTVRYEDLLNIKLKYENIQEQLEIVDSTDYAEDCEAFQKRFFYVKARFHEFLNPVVQTVKSRHSSRDSSQESSPSIDRRRLNTSNIKLPVIQLPSFDGNYSQWLSFKDTFEALIISNNQLTDVQTSLLAVIP